MKRTSFGKTVTLPKRQEVLRVLVALLLALLLAGYGKAHAGQTGAVAWPGQPGGEQVLLGQDSLSRQADLTGPGNLVKESLTGLGKQSPVFQAMKQLSSSAMVPKEGELTGKETPKGQRAGSGERFTDRLKRMGLGPSHPLFLFYRGLEELGLLG